MAVHQQSYTNSCGAASLLCAAEELGIAVIPQNLNYVLLAAGPTNLVLNQACESQLYQVTSNNPVNVNPHAWGYSMPSQVVACARMLGLQAWAVADATWSVRALKILYSNELSALRAMNALVEPGGSRSSFRPVGHQRVLKVLLDRSRANFGGMHFVMVRPDGSVMEPGAGEDHASIENAKTAVNMHGTGLSVFVQI
jgi:hypothetical protein